MDRKVMFALLALSAAPLSAQVNQKGTFQLGLGYNLGIFATEFEWSYENPFTGGRYSERDTDGAVTSSFPFDFQYGLGNRFSLGLYIEPGAYLDSNATQRNAFFIAGIDPRFYIVNKERFAWFADLGIGFSVLGIVNENEMGAEVTDAYAGGHLKLGTHVQFYFGNTFGIHFGMNYAAHNLKWRDRDPEDQALDLLDYEATLKTAGIQFGFGAQVKF
jgi:hypothetical protein